MIFFRALFVALLCLTASPETLAREVPKAEIWFNPRQFPGWLDMFRDDTAWKAAAARVDVLVLEPSFVLAASSADILTLTNYARARGKKLAFVSQAIARPTNRYCGGTEGYSYAGEMKVLGVKLKTLGITLDYLALDGPFWSGYYDLHPLSCQATLPELSKLVASTVNDFLALYPKIRLVDIEPASTVTTHPGWQTAFATYLEGLRELTGRGVEAIQLDVNWAGPASLSAVAAFDRFTRQTNRRLGIIYNGGPADQNDAEWIATAVNAFERVEGWLGIQPSHVQFISWQVPPARNLPESDPTTLTSLINRYARPASRLEVQANGGTTTGKLTSATGEPIANATIRLVLPGVDLNQPLPQSVIEGTVPMNATQSIVGARLNTECLCDGKNDVLLGPMAYVETAGGSKSHVFTYPVTSYASQKLYVTQETVGGTRVSRIIALPGQSWLANSDFLPVTPGARFRLTIPAGTFGGDGWFGHALIIWFDANRQKVGSALVHPSNGETVRASAVTRADGTFVLPRVPRTSRGDAPPIVSYAGDATHRAATWSRRTP